MYQFQVRIYLSSTAKMRTLFIFYQWRLNTGHLPCVQWLTVDSNNHTYVYASHILLVPLCTDALSFPLCTGPVLCLVLCFGKCLCIWPCPGNFVCAVYILHSVESNTSYPCSSWNKSLSICLSVCLSVCLSIYLFQNSLILINPKDWCTLQWAV